MPRPRKYTSLLREAGEATWLITEDKLLTIQEVLDLRAAGETFTETELAERIGAQRGNSSVQAPGGVAVINVFGVLMQRAGLIEQSSGVVSTETLSREIAAAEANPDISTIVFNYDSPGGSAFFIEETAAQIRSSKKRTISVANSFMASGALWLGTAAKEVVITPSGMIGSLGAMSMHVSTAEKDKKDGVERTVIRVPDKKAEGVGGEPLTEDAMNHRKKMIGEVYERFLSAVATNRGVTTEYAEKNFGGGRILTASEAKAVGLVDRIATLEDVLTGLGVGGKTSNVTAKTPAFSIQEVQMNPKIFGALVRIGMCSISATDKEANAALERFIAAKGLKPDAQGEFKDEALLAAIDAHISESVQRSAAPLLPLPANTTVSADDRSADIMAAVRISNVPKEQQLEFATQLIQARGADGLPIDLREATRRIQTEVSRHDNPAGATVITATSSERETFQLNARNAIVTRMFAGNHPTEIFDMRSGSNVSFRPTNGHNRLASLLGLAEECMVQGGFGLNTVRNLPPATVARLALGTNPQTFGINLGGDAAYNVSGMFTNILLDAANVGLRRSYDDARTTFQRWMKRGESLRDFKEVHKVIAGELADPKAVPENSDFEETTLSDGKEKYSLTVWGSVFSVSWQTIVNDRLSAFTEIPVKQGNAMKRKQNRLAYGILKDNPTMADTGALFNNTAVTSAGGHNNLTTGSISDYSAAFTAMDKKMREQKGVDATSSGVLNIAPEFVLFPPAIRQSIFEVLGSTARPSASQSGVANIYRDAYEPIEEAELGAAAGGSDTALFLAASSMDVDTIEYAYLQGLETPVIEMEPSFDRLAMRIRNYHAFAVKAIDYRGLQKHAGA